METGWQFFVKTCFFVRFSEFDATIIYDACALDTIEDHGTQIRRVWLGDLTILSNFHIETSSL